MTLGLRIGVTIDAICVAQRFSITLTLMPAVLKICIGIEQSLTILEIAVKVRESDKQLALRRLANMYSTRGLEDRLAERQRHTDRLLVALRLFVLTFILSVSIWALTRFV